MITLIFAKTKNKNKNCSGLPGLAMNELHQSLQRNGPVFRAHVSDISFISLPKDFYDTILKKISTTKRLLCISSLYIGTDSLSKKMVLSNVYL